VCGPIPNRSSCALRNRACLPWRVVSRKAGTACSSHCESGVWENFAVKLEPCTSQSAALSTATRLLVVEVETPTPVCFPTLVDKGNTATTPTVSMFPLSVETRGRRSMYYEQAYDRLPPHKLCCVDARQEMGAPCAPAPRPARSIRTTFISSCLMCV
jgi:hypothetical protein